MNFIIASICMWLFFSSLISIIKESENAYYDPFSYYITIATMLISLFCICSTI